MANGGRVIENQVFFGVPWRGIMPKFETVLNDLKDEYPVHCVVFGRTTDIRAAELWQSIKTEIDRSAATVFDVTGSNPNVALEFGYAEALGKHRILTNCESKSRKSSSKSIMSDLAGQIRAPYRTTRSLKPIVKEVFDTNPYVVRYQRTMKSAQWGKRKQNVALGVVRQLAGGKRLSKPDLTVAIEAEFSTYNTVDVPALINEMKDAKLLIIKRGPQGGVTIPMV
jgi:nucleoside 2-deoxyribosyltransferase